MSQLLYSESFSIKFNKVCLTVDGEKGLQLTDTDHSYGEASRAHSARSQLHVFPNMQILEENQDKRA